MSIHDEHPFRPAEGDRNPVRRLRGRLPSPVTIWTAQDGEERAGLTVSSLLVADGDPGVVVAVLDPLADLWDVLHAVGACVVNLLGWRDRRLADAFGYVAPAPGGPFRAAQWQPTEWGPVLVGAAGWAGCRLVTDELLTDTLPADTLPADMGAPLGWGREVRLTIEHVELPPDENVEDGADTQPLLHYRGRYAHL